LKCFKKCHPKTGHSKLLLKVFSDKTSSNFSLALIFQLFHYTSMPACSDKTQHANPPDLFHGKMSSIINHSPRKPQHNSFPRNSQHNGNAH